SHAACYSWVAYQTAYLKANYPAEFMAALLTRRKSDIKEVTKLMDECRALGIECLGPDVNESFANFGVNKNGAIRYGLAAIKGMGEGAALAIIDERTKNGPYADIYDFIHRVPLTQCNKKCVESLALAGAFDSFGIRREMFFSRENERETFLDVFMRYGQRYQSEAEMAHNSLFGSFDAIEIARPKPTNEVVWSDIERLNREKELVGIYLSSHPLDEYSVIIKHLCNVTTQQLTDQENYNELYNEIKTYDIKAAGMVTSLQERISRRGNSFGIVRLEDFEGVGELVMFGEAWPKWHYYLTEGSRVLINATLVPGRFDRTKLELNILSIESLPEVKDKLIERVTVKMPFKALDENFVRDFDAIAEPGKVELSFVFFDTNDHSRLSLTSRRKINLTKKVINFLDNNEKVSYVINS
ncbi:MAG: DNA polymerase III subunit alpha, partial [Bacteroidaceae bacterium]|nr:DNA polymerase III subunit alpha [Bacteroidaceae bacterium]